MPYLNLSRLELLPDPVPIELVFAWYPLEPELKLLTSDSLFVKSKSNLNGGKTLLGFIKISGTILKEKTLDIINQGCQQRGGNCLPDFVRIEGATRQRRHAALLLAPPPSCFRKLFDPLL